MALVLVLVTLSIAGQAITGVLHRASLDAAAQQLVGDLHRARVMAISANRPVVVRVTPPHSYSVDQELRSLPDGVTFASAPDSVRFVPLGPLTSGAADFVVGFGPRSRRVAVSSAGLAVVP